MTDINLDLKRLRQKASTLVSAILWIQVPLVGLACWINDVAWLFPLGACIIVAAIPQGVARFDPSGSTSRIAGGVSLMASISILVGIMGGQRLQVDLHMYYFAGLAILVICCDWRAIVAGAATVAVHHIALNFLLAALIYPGGADIARLALHATTLLVEASALAWVSRTIERNFQAVAQAVDHAERSRVAAEEKAIAAVQAERQAEAAHQINEENKARVIRDDEVILAALAGALRHLAEGDLTFTLDAELPAKVEALRSDLNMTVRSLRSVMQSVSTSAAHVRSSTEDMSGAAEDLSRRTEQQAANLTQTTSALDAITATVGNTARGASKAHKVAGSAKTEVELSNKIVHEAIGAMSGIERSSQQIGQIIGVIDEIAFQTNLLALNAGVEAARAGDSGRGFAVVASEVRALAQRSADAAREIKALISASRQHVERGVALVGQTGGSLARIVAQVDELDGIVNEIATSATDQATALGQVNSAFNQVGQLTQQNAAMAEQSTAAGHALSQETQVLADLIRRFRIDDADGPSSGRRQDASLPRRAA